MRTALVRLTPKDIPLAPVRMFADQPSAEYLGAMLFTQRRGVRVRLSWACMALDAWDFLLEGDGLPLRCQHPDGIRLTLREVLTGMDDYTALILGVGADV